MVRVATRLLLVLGSLLVGLLLVEIGLRTFMPEIGWRPFVDTQLGWSTREYREFDPLADGPPDGRPRVLVLGDSFLAGSLVPNLDARFPTVMQERLGGRVLTRILSAGGWGTDVELLAFLQKGVAWQPDVVVVGFCANNDVANVVSDTHGRGIRKPYFLFGEDGELELYDTRGERVEEFVGSGDSGVAVQSYLLEFLKVRVFGQGRGDGDTGTGTGTGTDTDRDRDRDRDRDTDTDTDTGADADGDADADAGWGRDPRYALFHAKPEPDYTPVFELRDSLDWSPQLGLNSVTAYIHEDFELNTLGWNMVEAVLRELRAEVERAGAELVVMLLPVTFKPRDAGFIAGGSVDHVFQTPDGPFTFRAAEPRDRLAGICERAGIRFFDPTPAFIEKVVSQDLLEACWPYLDNRHFSHVAHSILAQQLGGWLQSELGLLGD